MKVARYKIIVFIMLVNLFLNVQGNNWGLPSRWHSDEKVANVLHMLSERSLIDRQDQYFFPTGYQYALGFWLLPYLAYLQAAGYPFGDLAKEASVSWANMADKFPDFAANVYLYARGFSALLGALTVFLLYLLVIRLYGRRAALFSAATLALSMGFVAVNHYAKYPSLLNAMIVLNLLLYICMFEQKDKARAGRLALWGAFSLGAAVSTKFNAALLLVPFCVAFLLRFMVRQGAEEKKKIFWYNVGLLARCLMLFAAGFLILSPWVLFKAPILFKRTMSLLVEFGVNSPAVQTPAASYGIQGVFVRIVNNLIKILSMQGVALFGLTLCGIFLRIRDKRVAAGEWIFFSFIVPYSFLVIFLLIDTYPKAKYTIALIPFLSIFSGYALDKIVTAGKGPRSLRYALAALLMAYSFFYCFKSDLVFKKEDTRYRSTFWIRQNIKPGTTLEVFSQTHRLFLEEIIKDYKISYLGTVYGMELPHSPVRWIDIAGRNEYVRKIRNGGPKADYIVLNVDLPERLKNGKYLSYLPGVSDFVTGLFENKYDYALVKTFKDTNPEIRLEVGSGIYLPKNLLWNPVPDYEAVSPAIYIFERQKRPLKNEYGI